MTNLEVSCPYCGKNIVIAMEQKDNQAAAIFEKMFGSVKQYSFNGGKDCVCGKSIVATLTVTGG